MIAATRQLVFERRHARISIQDITRRAGVATGTFYNYFETKRKVFSAIADDYRQQFAMEIEQTRSRVKDPAMMVTITLQYYFKQAQHNEQWKTFIEYAGLQGLMLRQGEQSSLDDLRHGVRAGRFKVEDVFFAHSLISGMIDHTNQAISEGRLTSSDTDNTVRYVLRMLGLPDLVARALIQSPLPPM